MKNTDVMRRGQERCGVCSSIEEGRDEGDAYELGINIMVGRDICQKVGDTAAGYFVGVKANERDVESPRRAEGVLVGIAK